MATKKIKVELRVEEDDIKAALSRCFDLPSDAYRGDLTGDWSQLTLAYEVETDVGPA